MTAFALVVLAAPRPAHAEESSRDERIRRAEDLLAREPSFHATVQAAVRFHDVDPDALRGALRRMRSKAAVPYVRVSDRFEQTRAHRTLDDSGPNFSQIDSSEDFVGSRDAAVAMVAWDLPQTVFNAAELQTYQQSGMQMYITALVNRLYFLRRQLLLSFLVDAPVDQRARAAARLRVEGFTSILNTFTGGWFGAQLPEGSF